MKLLSAIVIGIAVIIAPAHAQLTANSDAPIDITGESAEFQDNTAIWTGNVRVVQDSSILTATKLEATLSEDGDFTSITASGDVRYSNGKEAITGQRAVFDNVARTITMFDDVIVTQGKQVMSAGSVIYWVDSGKVKFVPAEGARIRGVFHTKTDDQS